MEIIKKENINQLFDLYNELLTSYQKEVFSMYYEDDLSLNEIAEYYKVSKNAIFKVIKRVEDNLIDYESKLHLYSKYQQIIKLCEDKDIKNLESILKVIEE